MDVRGTDSFWGKLEQDDCMTHFPYNWIYVSAIHLPINVPTDVIAPNGGRPSTQWHSAEWMFEHGRLGITFVVSITSFKMALQIRTEQGIQRIPLF